MESPEGTSYVSDGDRATVPIQVENDGNQEEEYLLSHRSSIMQQRYPVSMVHGRPPLMKHAHNEEDQAKDGLQEASIGSLVPGDRKAAIPEHLYRYPSDQEVEQFIPTVRDKLQESCDKFPSAYGLVIAFSNEVGCENTQHIPNIHISSETVCKAFSKLGYAHCTFTEYHKVEILAVYHQLSRMSFPSSYKAIFIYFTGHGQKHHISTMDGYISINHLKNLLSDSNAPKLADIMKVLFFDCCRTKALVKGISQSPSVENLIVIYMTPLGQQSFIVNDAGMSVGTIELVKLLEREERCGLTKMFSVDLCREVKAAVRRFSNGPIDLRTDFEGSLHNTMDLYQDKMTAMSPTEVQLTEDVKCDTCTLTWQKPLHADHQQLMGYYIASPQEQGKWETIQDEIPAADTSCELRCDQVCGKKLTVIARYSEVDVLATEYGGCQLLNLQSEAIKPGNVLLRVLSSGEGTLTWSSSASGQGDDQLVTIQRRELSPDHSSEEGWVVIGDKIQVEDNSYPIAEENIGDCEYRVKVHTRGMDSRWVPAIKQSPQCRIRQKLKAAQSLSLHCSNRCVFITLCLLSPLILAAAYMIVCPSFQYSIPRHKDLAIGGDVVDCERLEPWQKWFYSDVSITQEATDTVNDNKNGLEMKIMSVPRDKLIFHPYIFNGTADVYVTTDTEPFVIPDDYFNRPYYMWEGSNVTVRVKLHYKVRPVEVTAYIILGDEDFNSFAYDPLSKPCSEHSFDLLREGNQTFHYTLENHGYYYIVVQAKSKDAFHFLADVQFEMLFISGDDYDFSGGSDSQVVGQTVHSSFGIHDRGITLCSVSEQAGDLDSNTIHVLLHYGLRASIVFVIPLSVLLFIFLLFLIFGIKVLVSSYGNSGGQTNYQQLKQCNS